MAPRSLLDLVLKVLGIFFIRDILEAFSRTLSVLVYFPQYSSHREAFFNLAVTIPPLILYAIFSWLLIFRTGWIIDVLRFDRNFGNKEVNVNVPRSVVLSLAVIIIGGWLLANEIPEFFRHAMYYYQERKMYVRMVRPDVSYMVMSAIKILIGFGLIIFNKPIARMVETISKNNVQLRSSTKSTTPKRDKQIH